MRSPENIYSLGPVPLESANISSSSASRLSLFFPFSFALTGATTSDGIVLGIEVSTTSTTRDTSALIGSLSTAALSAFLTFFFWSCPLASLSFALAPRPSAALALAFDVSSRALSLPLTEPTLAEEAFVPATGLAGFENMESMSVTAAVGFVDNAFDLVALGLTLEDDA